MNLVKLRCENCGELCNFDTDSGKKGVICRSCGSRVYYKPENIVTDEPQMQEAPQMNYEQPMQQEVPQMGYPQQEQPMYDNYDTSNMPPQMGQPMMPEQQYPEEQYPEMPPTVKPRKGKRGQQMPPQMQQQGIDPMQEQMQLQRNKKAKLEAQAPTNLQPRQKSSGGGNGLILIVCILALVASILSFLTATKTNKTVVEMKDKLEQMQSQPATPAAQAPTAAPVGQGSDVYDTTTGTSNFGNAGDFGTPVTPDVQQAEPQAELPQTLDGGMDVNGNLLTDPNTQPAEGEISVENNAE